MDLKSAFAKLRHNAGEALVHALDDVRQKVVEEGWFGATQTPAKLIDHQHSDPFAALYGADKPDPNLAWINRDTLHSPGRNAGVEAAGRDRSEELGVEL